MKKMHLRFNIPGSSIIWRLGCPAVFLLFACFSNLYAQSTSPFKDDLLKLTRLSDSITHIRPVEKLYLQFDKPYYALGDTIWFKAYLLNEYLTASDKSRIVNIDIANDSNKVIKQYRLPVGSAVSWGNISLDEKEGLTTGTYTIRAYTNWMRNFGDNYFFYKSFYVANVTENTWLVNRLFKDSLINGSNIAEVKLQFSDMDKKLFMVEPLTLLVMKGGKNLYKQKVQTDLSGEIDVNFAVPQKATNLAIIAESEKKDKRAVIPITLNRPENTDVQFLPEGGNLVAGLSAHIAFKAIGEDGKGVQISGIITNHNQQQVAQFQSLHNGMGSFNLAVNAGETYIAKVTLPGGSTKEYPLPAIKTSGTVLNIKNPMETDSLEVFIAATNDLVQSNESYFLIGKARGVVCYAAIFSFNNGNSIKRKIFKGLFPTGIAHFTVMTNKNQPLNERLVFIDHHDNLNITFSTDKTIYTSRDSVALQIKVTDNNQNPISGNFSLAVTDDAVVKTDTLNSENIISRMLLTSDLKGYIEGPGYYFSSKNKESWFALDNMLLAQGWIGYDWRQVYNPPSIAYQPETEFKVKGSVTNIFNGPVKGTNVLLFSKAPSMLLDTVTDSKGFFIFDRLPKVDTPIFIIKAVNKNGKSFNVIVKTDDIERPAFTKPFAHLTTPWYVNNDGSLLNYTKNDALAKEQKDFPKGGRILKEVKILAKKFIKGSQNLNGAGDADFVMDEKDLEKAGKKTWLDLLQENIKGFRIGGRTWPLDSPHIPTSTWYFINDKCVRIIIDGFELDSTFSQRPSFLDEKNLLESHNAEDIKGIELNYSSTNTVAYQVRFPPEDSPFLQYTFIEITTRSGHGPFFGNTPGMYLYKPIPISWPKQFYKPKYTVKDTAKHLPDLRSTIDWEPNITTDADGKATISFFTADKPSTYTLIMEGCDLNGNLGYVREKVEVGKSNEKSK